MLVIERQIEDFVERDYPRVVGAVRLVTGSHHSAEDAVQDALLKAWSRSGSLDIESLPAWVTVVASNNARSMLRRRGAESRAYERTGADPPESPGADCSLDAIAIEPVLRRLPERQREVAVLFYLLDQSVSAIAQALDVTEGTVKTSLSRARAALGRALGDEGKGGDDD